MGPYIYHSKIPVIEKKFYFYLLWPVVMLKNMLSNIYHWLLKMIFAELIKAENDYDDITNLVAFIILCFFSYIFYLLKGYDDYVILCGLILWLFDNLWAKHIYTHPQKYYEISISLVSPDNYLIKTLSSSGKEFEIGGFSKSEVKQIIIHKDVLKAGAFYEKLKNIWRINIQFNDKMCMVDESTDYKKIINNAFALCNILEVKLKFDNCEIRNISSPYISQNNSHQFSLRKQNTHLTNINYLVSEDSIKIHRKRNFKSFILEFKDIADKSFFFLFILIFHGVLERIGKVIHFFISPLVYSENSELIIDLNFLSLIGLFKPGCHWLTLAEWIIAILIILIYTLESMQRKSFIINKKFLVCFIGKRKIELNLHSIQFIAAIKKPELSFIIFDKSNIVEINKFRDEFIFMELFHSLSSAIDSQLTKKNIVKNKNE